MFKTGKTYEVDGRILYEFYDEFWGDYEYSFDPDYNPHRIDESKRKDFSPSKNILSNPWFAAVGKPIEH